MFGDAIAAAVADAAKIAARLRTIDDVKPEDFKTSRRTNDDLRKQIKGARGVFDLWTAEPLGLAGARDEASLRGDEVMAGRSTSLLGAAHQLSEQEHFLHWPLAFPEVFARERPGFDAVVGNPPWEEVNVEELAFYARYRPGLRGMSERRRSEEIARLTSERPELPRRLAIEQQRFARLRPYFATDIDYSGSPGNADLYKFFCQRYGQLVRPGGSLGVVLPRTVFWAKGSEGFRNWLFDHAAPRRIDFLVNLGSWAFDIHPQISVALLIAKRRAAEDNDEVTVAGIADSAVAFAKQVAGEGLRLRRCSFGRMLEIPLLSSQAEADILAKLRTGEAFPFGDGRWQCFPVQGDFNETTDRLLWEGAVEGRPLWKGESFDQFNPHGAEERLCSVDLESLSGPRDRPGARSLLAANYSLVERLHAKQVAVTRARVVFRDVTNRLNKRTVIACLIPRGTLLVNSAPYLTFLADDCQAEAACLATLNSLAFDWQARRFVERHLSFFILEGLRLPPLDNETYAALAEASASLSCVDERFTEFASATGVECGPRSENDRARLRVEIDARVAHAYNLTPDELEVVFSDFTFDAVPEAYREMVRERFAELV